MTNAHNTFPPVPSVRELIWLGQKSAHLGNGTIPDQHVVSQVLQRRFTEPRGTRQELKLSRINLNFPDKNPREGSPRSFGKVREYVKFASRSLEEFWKRTEDRMYDALNAVETGQLDSKPIYAETIRDAVVLHCVRNIPAPIRHQAMWFATRQRFRDQWLKEPTAARWLFRLRCDRLPRNDQELISVIDQLTQSTDRLIQRNFFIRGMLEDRFHRYRQGLSGHILQILTPKAGEFLFGDIPALCVRRTINGIDEPGSVGLANADEIVLPLTSRHMAVLRRDAGTTDLTQDKVDAYNRHQIKAANTYVHFRPSSGLEAFVRQTVLLPQQPAGLIGAFGGGEVPGQRGGQQKVEVVTGDDPGAHGALSPVER